ncbi:hypothetical protein AVEN_123046-1, partial [Araneus ventricosus]
ARLHFLTQVFPVREDSPVEEGKRPPTPWARWCQLAPIPSPRRRLVMGQIRSFCGLGSADSFRLRKNGFIAHNYFNNLYY